MFRPQIRTKYGARIAIIGGGGTGAALAYDLTLRGFSVVLLEQGELSSGTTGRHHGQLHSGARYAVGDRLIAKECMEECFILKHIVPETIEYNGGLFIATNDEEADYAPQFIEACNEAEIPAREIAVQLARSMEPIINPAAKRTVWVPDGSFDAFRLVLAFFAAAKQLGADIKPFCKVNAIEVQNGRATALYYDSLASGRTEKLAFDYIVSASGAWAAQVGCLAGLDVALSPAPGTMLAVQGRLSDMVLSRLAPPGDGDIIVPQRGLSIIGTTHSLAENPDCILPNKSDAAFLLKKADELAPGFSSRNVYALWAAARPLAGRSSGDAREISRDFKVLSHAPEGVAGMCSLIGGKATVLRAMAEKAADLICSELGINETCRTKDYILPSWRSFYLMES